MSLNVRKKLKSHMRISAGEVVLDKSQCGLGDFSGKILSVLGNLTSIKKSLTKLAGICTCSTTQFFCIHSKPRK